MNKEYDVAIIGGGPGGYVAAIRSAQLGKKVVLIERDKIGGICMNYGCIPTKYLLHQTKLQKEIMKNKNLEGPVDEIWLNWKKVQKEKNVIVGRLVKGIEFLLKRNKVDIITGQGLLESETKIRVNRDEEEIILKAKKIILATGSRAADLHFLKPDGEKVVTSWEAMEWETLPQKLLIIGAGAIGLEMATIYHRMGCDVAILEVFPNILPESDKETACRLEKILIKQGFKIFTQMKIEKAEILLKEIILDGICLKDQSPFSMKADKVLLAVGRKPNSNIWSARHSRDFWDQQDFIKVNQYLETQAPGVYAIGDVIGGKLLAHKASHEGLIVSENAAGRKKRINYNALPSAVYTDPEIASVGVTETEAFNSGDAYQSDLFSLQANGRALTMGQPEGLVKIIADKEDKIIGAHILAPNASELIAELAMAIHKSLKLQDVASTIHVHPTLSESVMEAALKVKNRAIHALNDF